MRWHKRPDRLHAKAAPPPKDEEEYMERVLQRVRFRFDRPSIRRELLAHLEDKALWLRQQGCGPEEASHRALQEMGDPEETGRALNKTHNPVLGWIWLVTGALARVAAGLSVLLALYLAVDYLLPNSIPAEIDRDEIKEVVEQGCSRMNTPPKLRFRLQMPFLYHPAGYCQCSTASCWR